jgi:hypothetical protein
MDSLLEVQLFGQRGEIVGEFIVIVSGPRLTRSPVPAAIVGDASKVSAQASTFFLPEP